MFNKTAKVPTIVLWVVSVLSVLVLIGYLTKILSLDLFLVWAYVLVIASTVAVLFYPMIQLFTNLQALKNFAIVVGIFGALVFGAYALADGTPSGALANLDPDEMPSAQTLKFADTGIYMSYFLLAIAVVGIVFSEISKRFK